MDSFPRKAVLKCDLKYGLEYGLKYDLKFDRKRGTFLSPEASHDMIWKNKPAPFFGLLLWYNNRVLERNHGWETNRPHTNAPAPAGETERHISEGTCL